MVKRIFVIEPGLIKMTGHPMQYALALQLLGHSKGLEVHIVPNRNIESKVLAYFHSSFPAISRTCFQFTPDGSITFYHDLCRLNKRFSFDEDDIIVITSSYSKEIEGTAMFMCSMPSSCRPRIAINFHQLFPPAPVSSMVCTREYQERWRVRLRKAFNFACNICNIHTNVSFWTTLCKPLNEDYRTVSECQVGMLPFLFARPERHRVEVSKYKLPGELKLAFLGDGRQEKGLLLFLNAIDRFVPTGQLGFVIQSMDTRGYEVTELQALKKLLFKTKLRPDTAIIAEPLSPEAFHDILCAVDAVVLPYDPKHYDRRASMLFAQAVVYQKPVVVPSGTWMSEEIKKNNASGVIFDYMESSWNTTVTNLAMSISEMQKNIRLYRLEAKKRSRYYQTLHTAERYLQTILDYYERRLLQ